MTIGVRERDGVKVLNVEGKITIELGNLEPRDAMQEVVNGGATRVVLNVRDVNAWPACRRRSARFSS